MDASPEELAERAREAVTLLEGGTILRRVKFRSIGAGARILLSADHKTISYWSKYRWWYCVPEKFKSLEISQILEVRGGWSTDNFHRASKKRKFTEEVDESRCFSIVFRHRILFQKSIDLVAESSEIRNAWLFALSHLLAVQRRETSHFNEEKWLMDHFKEADKNKNGSLSFAEIWELLSTLNLELSEEYGRKIFEESDFEKSETLFGEPALNKAEFLRFFKILTARPELQEIMIRFSASNTDFFLPADLQKFLSVEQGCYDISLEKCEELIKKYEPEERNRKSLIMNINGFRKFLLSKHGSIFRPEHEQVFQDTRQPLPAYYVNSSHNTYLVGGQIRGEASVEGYIRALQRGARLLEIDAWNGSDGEPIVTHGHTLVKPILLRDVAVAIRNYAFVASPYPVVLSLENHCSLEQQVRMAEIFSSVLGDKLYRREFTAADERLPSPEDLRGKILLKGKRMSGSGTVMVDGGVAMDSATHEMSTYSEEEESEEEMEEGGLDETDGVREVYKQKRHRVAPELSAIISLASVKLHSIEGGLAEHPVNSFASLSEGKMQDFLGKDPAGVAAYTSRHMLKSYPKGLRTDSSNMEPVGQWLAGVQIVTMNMQTPDLPTDLNEGLFRQNGGIGYVLKPGALQEGRMDFDAVARQAEQLVIQIKVISGQYLPKSDTSGQDDIIDPYVTLEVYGFPCDSQKFRTNTVHNNGFNPRWNEAFILRVREPEFALLRICVKDYDKTSSNDFVGQYTLPIRALRRGYSHVHLETGFAHLTDPSATLFIHTVYVLESDSL